MNFHRAGLIALLLALFTAAVYWRVGGHPFILYDDPPYVTANVQVQRGWTRDGVVWAFTRLHGEQTYWHPLTWLSHMLDCQLFGLNAGAHHRVNVLFHALNAALLFLFLNRATGAVWRSAIVAALFAVHPLQVDTVAWVAERKNVLSTLFWMLASLAYVRYATKPGVGRYLLVAALMALGLMAKPALVTLPCVFLLLDFWPLRRFSFAPRATSAHARPAFATASAGWLVIEKLPLLLLSAASSVITILAHEGIQAPDESLGLPPRLRLANALVSGTRYIDHTLWPVNLTILYPHPGTWPATNIIVSAIVLAVITAAVLRFRKRSPYLAVGWFWFLGVLVPMSGLVHAGVQAMADRFMYVPVIGLLIMLVWGARDFAPKWKNRPRVLATLAAGAVAACVVATTVQLRHWKSSRALFERAVAVTRNNYIMHHNLGYALAEAGRLDDASWHVAEALRIKPDFARAHVQLGLILELKGRPQEALEHFREAVRLRSWWPLALKRLGDALFRAGHPADAGVHYAAALELKPDDLEAHFQLGVLSAFQRQTAAAIGHYRAALRLRPDWPEALNNLAWLLATHPAAEFRDGAEAVRLAERAVQLTDRRAAVLLGTLAAAYAECGRSPEAVRTAQEARDLARSQGAAELAARNEELLRIYEAGKPFRDEAANAGSAAPARAF